MPEQARGGIPIRKPDPPAARALPPPPRASSIDRPTSAQTSRPILLGSSSAPAPTPPPRLEIRPHPRPRRTQPPGPDNRLFHPCASDTRPSPAAVLCPRSTLQYPRPIRSVPAFLRARWPRKHRKARPSKLRVLREVYTDYKALRGPRLGFWARLAATPTLAMAPAQTRTELPPAPGSFAYGAGAGTGSTLVSASSSTPPTLRPALPPSPHAASSRRQRLLGFARATRDTYIPRLATLVTLLASGVAPRSLDLQYDESGLPVVFPSDTSFTLFPSYTRLVSARDSPTGHEGYLLSVRGWMWCPGLMSRKNRLVLSLAKQVTKGRSSRAAQSAVDQLNGDAGLAPDAPQAAPDDFNDSESLASASSAASSGSSDVPSADQLIKERLGAFIARSVAKAHLAVVVGAADPTRAGPLCEKHVVTDLNGHFECDIFTPYEPSVFQVTSTTDETVTACQEVHILQTSGFGVISDIDDTVKLTGVIGDKRELLSKILVGNIHAWNIPQVVAWYQDIFSRLDASFHYVSNSPWQLFSLISQYFEHVKLPRGSFHLKQYSGNIIASLMEPSSSRKSLTLQKILRDFPNKRFICIGDSGEQDMEAYTDLARLHPDRIAAIYIRAVPNSFSSVDDSKVLNELKWMTSDWEKRQTIKSGKRSAPGSPDLIDLSDSEAADPVPKRLTRLPPMVPRKPTALKGNAIRKLPPLPERRYMLSNEHPNSDPEISGSVSSGLGPFSTLPTKSLTLPPQSKLATPPPPPPPPLRRKKPPVDDMGFKPVTSITTEKAGDNLSLSYGVNDFFEPEDVDGKAALWIQRLHECLHNLDGTNTKLAFFEDSDEDFFKSALKDL
ncbi:hypothetical protein METBIDRAFT_12912 [Metschnikowia bicuspidata var. bicuspidata NRRL YB-4993]|uniref:Phosphatidate phosphatase APP1 catalytic domain-containing protein n=1 Tax=Metschnikowia bicuspidata var. bicuspidata NRRL YB-4993 TaxID=869754 RepID=A0A1A0H7K0_9ASCO|nr:hypothetical protein METBIDRAFT_12912 [Metschnikowia bicuspidata var. bicuspidata NRRL YB-4993]OBA19878.1 hypothetical protein METBIDRAFT_12912 [Metschnikowia bicuspidata var. bicuspidata NRRL YB-4993]